MANAGQWGGVSPTMNVFENQTSTRATVVIVKCYENHAQDARVREIQGGGMPHGRGEQCERDGDERQQSANTMETKKNNILDRERADARRIVNDEQPRSGEDAQ